jgi:two-component system sensor kinase FixL
MQSPGPDRREALLFAATIASAVDGIIVIDALGRIETFNPAAERLFGYRESEVRGQSVSMLMPSPHREQHRAYLERYLQTGEARIIGLGREVSGLRRDGTVFPLHISVGEMSVDGERKFVGTLHDLTARSELQERLRSSEERWKSVIESAVDGIVVIDARGRIEAFNPAAQRLFGYSEPEVIGHNVNMLMPTPYREQHDEYLASYLSGGKAKIIGIGREVTGRRADGSTFPLHLSVGEMALGGDRKFTGILRDLTERVLMEEQLREQAALVKLGEMAAVIAHEVKNPLAGIRGAVQVVGGRLPKESREAVVVGEVIARVDALNALVQDLLLFARPPTPNSRPLDVMAILEVTAELMANDPVLRGVRVDVEGSSPPVVGDGEMLRIVFLNLLINGAQAMAGQGRIRVSLRPSDAVCRIAFADDGPGIAPGTRGRIFDPFFTTKARGSGLGLPTSKRFVEAHHGMIDIDCPAGGGTTVTVVLPLASSQQQQAPGARSQP